MDEIKHNSAVTKLVTRTISSAVKEFYELMTSNIRAVHLKIIPNKAKRERIKDKKHKWL